MALTQAIERISTQSGDASSVRQGSVIPFRSSRALLSVTLPHASSEPASAPLRALLHSPLGVYVVGTDTARETVRVQLEIAAEDFDFTLHTLIGAVPAALIGPLTRRGKR